MKYTKAEVLNIIGTCTSENAETLLLNWNNNKANTPLDLEKWNYPYFVYSFPLILNEEEVATITLVESYGCGYNLDDYMQKYLGHEDYEVSWHSFSHQTYKDWFLTVKKEFDLPELVKGFYGGEYTAVDADGEEFSFKISYGYPENEEDRYVFEQYVDEWVRFENGVSIKMSDKNKSLNGWPLGEKINENIKKRVQQMNNEKMNQIIDEAYENYTQTKIIKTDSGETHISPIGHYNGMTKEQFINKCKTDSEFSERWGLKIEERECCTVLRLLC